MPPKLRYLAAQMRAYLKGGLWLSLAGHANEAARELADILVRWGEGDLAHPTDGNEVFVRLPEAVQAKLAEAGVGFYRWHDGSCRFVCSWATGRIELDQVRRALNS
jgi:threonine aldolase